MKLQNLKIGTQLRIGLGIILIFVLFLGAVAWLHADLLWRDTRELHDHPFTVQRAIGNIRADVLAMHRGMKDLCLTGKDQERQTLLQDMDTLEADAHRQFAIVFDRYLGPGSDVDAAHQSFVQWKAIRAETVRLLREGKDEEAIRRTIPGGPSDEHLEKMLGNIRIIDEFAKARGDRFYQDATRHNRVLNTQLAIIVAVIFFLCLILGYFLLKGIKEPLQELTGVANQFRQGNLNARYRYVSTNELGTLAGTFNTLAETVEGEMLFRQNAARINDAMLREIETGEFRRLVLELLTQLTGSEMGAVYLLNQQKTEYEHLESIGLAAAGRASFSAMEREGEFGAALTTHRLQRITDIPADSRFTFIAVSGELTPREILTIPLLAGEEIPAVISLASLRGYSPAAVRLVTDIQGTLSVWMNSMLANQRIRLLTEDLQRRNLQLQEQQEELRIANDELEEQAQRLLQSEEELKIQQEELQVTNEELEEKNSLLERQTSKVEKARREIEEKADELALAGRYKSEFLANMSHELRTPLNSLLLLAQGLVRNREGNLTAEQIEAARIIYGSGNDLLALINEILDLAKIEAGRIDFRPGRVRVADLVEVVRDSFQHLADEKGIDLVIIVTDEAPAEISSDHKRVVQIIRNLVFNAVKFTETGSVSVTFGRPAPGNDLSRSGLSAENCLAVSVQDTGIGIAPEHFSIIFEAFQQANGGTARKYGGTGLGLSISRELATLLGGEIQLESTAGKGSTFTLYLPQEMHRSEPVRSTAAAPPIRKQTSGERQVKIPDDRDSIRPSDRIMLVIEDDPDFALLLYGKCHEKGFNCLVAATGEEGLELATRHLPCAVILDLRLPGMDGWEVLNTLKENIRTRHIAVHIVSVEEPTTESLRKGAVGHFAKPVNHEQIEETFRRLEHVSAEKPKRVLVVDDNATVRHETAKLLGNGDAAVDEAENGEQALDALRSVAYDCMVLDLELPDMDGGNLLTRLEREGVALPPVVVYTARDLTMGEEEKIREHAESIVIKDVRSQERLLDEVSLFLHRVVSRMSDRKRKIIQDLHDTDTLLRDRKVLVVDDDMRTTFAIAHLLAESGIKALKAENGERALRLLAEQPDIDLVLTDIMMPVMDGYETIRQIRDQERFRSLPIIALTAKAMPEDRAKCLAAGANDYLPKPLDQGRLLSMLRVWLCR